MRARTSTSWTSPPPDHAEIAIAAAQAGKAVFCEKPLANTWEAKAMVAAVEAGVPNMVCHNYRASAVMLRPGTWWPRASSARVPLSRHLSAGLGPGDRTCPSCGASRRSEASSGARATSSPIPSTSRASCSAARWRRWRGRSDLHQAASAAGQPEEEGPGHGGRRRVPGALHERRAGRGDPRGPRRENYNRFEVNGQQGQRGPSTGAENELRVLLDRNDDGKVQGFRDIRAHHAYVKDGGRPGTAHAIRYEHTYARCTTSWKRWPRASECAPISRTASATSSCSRRSRRSRRWTKVRS